jgi:hypothetical protein
MSLDGLIIILSLCKAGLFQSFYMQIMKMLPEVLCHPSFSLENYVFDVFENTKMCNISQRFGLESGKHG